jgi:NADH-quinone oxidoreductase subunit D
MHVPEGEAYAAVEHPKGEFAIYLVSDGANKAVPHEGALTEFHTPVGNERTCDGHMLADASRDHRNARDLVRGNR